MNDQVRKIEEYIYARYVDFADHGSIDEDASRRVLEEWYGRAENAADPECCYLGILYFEQGFEDEKRKIEYLKKAKHWLERYRALSHEAWEAVDERLQDIVKFFENEGIEVGTSPPPPASAAAAAPAAHPAEIDDHGPMVFVPGGAFLFGQGNEVRVLPAYYVDKYPVTNRQYEAFCRDTGYRWPKYWTDPRFNGTENPVVGVSSADALKYCRWVGKDLPTEEQWEKAARGTDGRVYPWGNDDPVNGRACCGRDPADGSTDPVTSHPENKSPFGAMELSGNVWEWTSTTLEEGETYHVVKGGCYNDPAELIRADARLEAGPKDKFETIGFRCVKTV